MNKDNLKFKVCPLLQDKLLLSVGDRIIRLVKMYM